MKFHKLGYMIWIPILSFFIVILTATYLVYSHFTNPIEPSYLFYFSMLMISLAFIIISLVFTVFKYLFIPGFEYLQIDDTDVNSHLLIVEKVLQINNERYERKGKRKISNSFFKSMVPEVYETFSLEKGITIQVEKTDRIEHGNVIEYIRIGIGRIDKNNQELISHIKEDIIKAISE